MTSHSIYIVCLAKQSDQDGEDRVLEREKTHIGLAAQQTGNECISAD